MSKPQLDKQEILDLFGPEGLLSTALRGFEVREEQRAMICNIVDAYNENRIALIEAGTGTGKSLAYLLPAMLWAVRAKERTVISTNTINLQEQLITKDLPMLEKALGIELKAVLVKGMGNYVCLRKHEDSMSEMQLLSIFDAEEMRLVDDWVQQTRDGTKASLPFVPSSATWDRVQAETDTCSGNSCPHVKDCFFFKARAQAADAQILVVNHHLLFADLAVRAEDENYQDSCILPPYQRIIIDEAHNIEDTATAFFAQHANLIQAMRTLGRLGGEGGEKALGRIPALKVKFEDRFGKSSKPETTSIFQRLDVDLPAMRRSLFNDLTQVFRLFGQYAVQYAGTPEFGEDLSRTGIKLRLKDEHYQKPLWIETIAPAVSALHRQIQQYTTSLSSLREDIEGLEDEQFIQQTVGLRSDIRALGNRLEILSQTLSSFLVQEPNLKQVRWIERVPLKQQTNVHLVNADLDITTALVNSLFTKFPSIVLCSATLATNKNFVFAKKRLGLTPQHLGELSVIENIYDSPFDYQKQAMLAVPTDLPPPTAPEFIPAAAEAIWKLLQASRGNAFVLFTSYTALRKTWDILKTRIDASNLKFMKQGDENRKDLLKRFTETDYSVLFGTDSFWEGVDVAGDSLRSVIIVKLPFRVPTEPVIEARTEAILAEGGQPFKDYALPNAAVRFKQGFGRLIRHRRDRGCITCLDTRLITKGYGKHFLNSLPPCGCSFAPLDQIVDTVKDFYRKTYYLVAKK